jgi:hypothetical protein
VRFVPRLIANQSPGFRQPVIPREASALISRSPFFSRARHGRLVRTADLSLGPDSDSRSEADLSRYAAHEVVDHSEIRVTRTGMPMTSSQFACRTFCGRAVPALLACQVWESLAPRHLATSSSVAAPPVACRSSPEVTLSAVAGCPSVAPGGRGSTGPGVLLSVRRGVGRSFRTMTRIPAGQDDRFSSPVMSATHAPSLTRPSPS